MGRKWIATAIALAAGTIALAVLGLGAVGSASASRVVEVDVGLERSDLQGPVRTLRRLDAYRRAAERARRLELPAARGLRKVRDAELSAAELGRRTERLREQIRRATRFPSPASVGVSQGTLESIAACESGGDPAVVSASGDYRGKYQFSFGTWASVGGTGDPAAASEREQDYRAALLYARSGSSPWPVCG